MKLTILLTPILGLLLVLLAASAWAARPAPEDDILFARWLVNQSSYGVLSTLDPMGSPFGNIMSFTDGGRGVPYFYLTTVLDPTGANALHRSHASLTLTEYPLGFCSQTNEPQWPVCAKITLSGRLKMMSPYSMETAFAREALFRDHPQLSGWPTKPERGFRFFKLVINHIFLVNLMAPARYPNVLDYLRSPNI